MSLPSPSQANSGRSSIYYWKCDRPAAFHGTQSARDTAAIEPELKKVLQQAFQREAVQLRDGGGQGNHLTWVADIGDRTLFIRVEHGPEQDDHLEVESHVIECVRQRGVPTPKIYHVDSRRQQAAFAWQAMELIPAKDLNHWFKLGQLDAGKAAYAIGSAVARWQDTPVTGFGHFDPDELRRTGQLVGFHHTYRDYFWLNLERHLSFLVSREFLSTEEFGAIKAAIEQAEDLLTLRSGCLVHKDLAFWNVLGNDAGIAAFIDWDDAIAGDEMDDISLLACFHDAPAIVEALAGYQSVNPLPAESTGRFWLHLLRNMIVKSVIRVGAGYFDRNDGFFLIGAGLTGADLKQQTRSRLFRALDGLRLNLDPAQL
ncbi:phosphotransferase family protein [Planctomicrobium piriforme]|uniref:Fructosamine-3-kinase n=1 Tax=Planctomicrobium piriforme TaxID=1576369 RepID=A0A1I3RS59_9PLAN|nr:aminoglycoside phosphotransferase family protein [Planctomicrobium piriforme]SFJ48499.1 Fructosamine-3-kinase [Planctomicrobium piriforme]